MIKGKSAPDLLYISKFLFVLTERYADMTVCKSYPYALDMSYLSRISRTQNIAWMRIKKKKNRSQIVIRLDFLIFCLELIYLLLFSPKANYILYNFYNLWCCNVSSLTVVRTEPFLCSLVIAIVVRIKRLFLPTALEVKLNFIDGSKKLFCKIFHFFLFPIIKNYKI